MHNYKKQNEVSKEKFEKHPATRYGGVIRNSTITGYDIRIGYTESEDYTAVDSIIM